MELQSLPGSSLPQLWGPDHGKELELLEGVQRRPWRRRGGWRPVARGEGGMDGNWRSSI